MKLQFEHGSPEGLLEAEAPRTLGDGLAENRYIGKPVTRLEDFPLVTGRACFLADVSFPHQLHMRVVRSSVAHGRIMSIDTAAARQAPGVVAVWTWPDVREIPPIPFRETKVQGLQPYRQPILAQEYVRYVGEPVAVVFADDPYRAEDAADLVLIEIEDRPVIPDALAQPGMFDAEHGTEALILRKGYGDVDAALAAAYRVVSLELSIGRHSGVPLETRGALARHDQAHDHLELHGATKKPHWNRDQLAEMLGRPPGSIDLYETHVGGGFGIRGELYPEDVLVCLAALRLHRPVKWVEDRREHLMAANQSRQQTHRIKAAVDAQGRLLAIDEVLYHDQGGYIRTHGARVADMTLGLLLGPYEVPAYRAAGHFRLTNKTPAATFRSPGRFEGTFVRERLMDAIAHELGLDRIEVRRSNLIPSEMMPYDRHLDALETDVILDSGDYELLLQKALDRADWPRLVTLAAERRARGEAVGVGIAMFVEKSGLGPCDGARVSVDTAGYVEIVTGAASLGQGVETVLAQICAESLGVDYRRIRVIHGQTNRIAHGIGSHASRTTVMTGGATREAALMVREKAIAMASGILGIAQDDLTVIDGQVHSLNPQRPGSISLGDIARKLLPPSAIRAGQQPGLSAEGWFHSEHMNYPYGVHIALVNVDRETGGVKIERYLIAYDVGRAINPMLIEGQLVGGFAQGMGGALFEEFNYDEQGQPLSVTFADYLMPTAHEMPHIEVLITEDAPSPLNPLGMKGAGEGGVNAAGAAISSAIDDALGIAGAVSRLPVTPQRLYQILVGRRAADKQAR